MALSDLDDAPTLDPPGSIAIVGAGPLGIEAALYGRYLGYDVTLYEATAIGSSMLDRSESPLPMLPDRCLSLLAVSALEAQRAATADVTGGTTKSRPSSLPMTFGQWIQDALVPLTETDLLRNRLRVPAAVKKIVTVPVEAVDSPEDNAEDSTEVSETDSGDIPPDFRLTFLDDQQTLQTADAEAVILAIGAGLAAKILFGFELPTDYCFRIGDAPTGDPEQDLRRGHREIVALYAGLAGRSDLDLHRPRRG